MASSATRPNALLRWPASGAETRFPGPTRGERRERLLALLVCGALGAWSAAVVSMEGAWGYDESMHAALPAARMLVALRLGELDAFWEALHDCRLYPPAYPLLMAAAQALGGIDEATGRALGRLVWAAAAFGVFLLVQECLRALPEELRRPRAERAAPWVALACAFASPVAVETSGTLLLETPSTAAAVFALRAWVRRDGSLRRELAAGAWLTLALFTKFNYGLLLWAGLGADLALQTAEALRSGRGRAHARRVLALAALPALACAWWFLLPLPGGAALGAEHREFLVHYLGGNRGVPPVSPRVRLVDWSFAFAPTPRALALLALGAVASLPLARAPAVRALWLVLLCSAVPISLHPFHLPRLLLPVGAALWPLAGLGWARLLPASPLPRLVGALLLAVVALGAPDVGARTFARWAVPGAYARAGGDAVLEALRAKRALAPDRPLATHGLARAELEGLLDLLAAEVGPQESVLWIGGNERFPAAALHLGLLQRGGSPARFLREARRAIVLSRFAQDPALDAGAVLRRARRFDVVVATDPLDLSGQAAWDFLARYRDAILEAPDWSARVLGEVPIRMQGGLRPVRLVAARRAR